MDGRNGFSSGHPGQNQSQDQGGRTNNDRNHPSRAAQSQSPQSPQSRLPNFQNNTFSLDFLVNTNGPQYQTAHSHSPLSPGIPAGSPSYSPSSAAGHSPVVSTPVYGPHYQVQNVDGYPSLFPFQNNNHNLNLNHGIQNIQGVGAGSAAGQWNHLVQLAQAHNQQVPYSAGNPIGQYHYPPQPHPQPQPVGYSNIQNTQAVSNNSDTHVHNPNANANVANIHNVHGLATGHGQTLNHTHTHSDESNCSQTPPPAIDAFDAFGVNGFDGFNGFEGGVHARAGVNPNGIVAQSEHNDGRDGYRRSLDSVRSQDVYDARDVQVASHSHSHSNSQPNSQSHSNSNSTPHSLHVPLPLALGLSPESIKRVEQWSHEPEKQQLVINILSSWELTRAEEQMQASRMMAEQPGSILPDPKLPSNEDLLQLTRPHHNNSGNSNIEADIDADADAVADADSANAAVAGIAGISGSTSKSRRTANGNSNANVNGSGKKTGKGSRGKPIGYICIWPGCEDARTNKSLRSDRASEHVRAHLGMIPYRCHKGSMDFLRKADRDRHSKACKGGCAPRAPSIHAHNHAQQSAHPHPTMQVHTGNVVNTGMNMGMGAANMQGSNNFVYHPVASTSNHSLNSAHSSSQSPVITSPATVQSQSHQYQAQHRRQKRPRNLRGVSVDGSGSEEVSSGYASAPNPQSNSAPAATTGFYRGHGSGSLSPVAHRRTPIHHKPTLSGLSTISASSGMSGNGDYDYTHNPSNTQSSQTQTQQSYNTRRPFNTTVNTFTNANTTFDSPITISPHHNSLSNYGSPFAGTLQLTNVGPSQESNQSNNSNIPFGSDPHSYSHSRH